MAKNFRLERVDSILIHLSEDIHHHEDLRAKYCKYQSFFQNSSIIMGIISSTLTTLGVVTSFGPGVLVGGPIGAVGAFLGVISVGCNTALKKVVKKLDKHDRLIQLTENKKNIITDLISKALDDDQLDEKEFHSILSEFQEYENTRSSLRNKRNK